MDKLINFAFCAQNLVARRLIHTVNYSKQVFAVINNLFIIQTQQNKFINIFVIHSMKKYDYKFSWFIFLKVKKKLHISH